MTIKLELLDDERLPEFKKEMQRAFQLGAEAELGGDYMEVLPEADIDRSLSSSGAIAYAAVENGEMVGGAIVVINAQTQHNHLDFLFVKVGRQSKGVGKSIWAEIERRHPATKVWETCTPYFEKRNIHFYINRCGFHAVELMVEKHPEEHSADGKAHPERGDDLMFRFEKQMSPPVCDCHCNLKAPVEGCQ